MGRILLEFVDITKAELSTIVITQEILMVSKELAVSVVGITAYLSLLALVLLPE